MRLRHRSRAKVLNIVRIIWVLGFVAVVWMAWDFLWACARWYAHSHTVSDEYFEAMKSAGLRMALALVVLVSCTGILITNRRKLPITRSP